MKTIKKARKISSPLISGIMDELTPIEKTQTAVKMRLAAKLDDLIKQRGWSKADFADRCRQASVGNYQVVKRYAQFYNRLGLQYIIDLSVGSLLCKSREGSGLAG